MKTQERFNARSALIDFLSGRTVYMLFDRAFEKRREPAYRRKAQENGFGQQFEEELKVLRDRDADHASMFAYRNAQSRARQDRH
ncbi:MAG TPA: hypothetical protein VEC35_09270 [Noviherbaspirillum sp.]|nr:hypothetical protein [Noviherbaspirillum sp.]